MDKRVSAHTRKELLEALRSRYHDSSKRGKSRILDEFVAVSRYHRKHAIRLLGRIGGDGRRQTDASAMAPGRRVYDEAVREALIVTWEAADRICGKRLKAVLPGLVNAMERHLEFTRSRAYHKNDQAWIEQKNGAVVRRMVGHERFSGVIAGQALAHLYQSVRLYVNFFQPSFKLRDKVRRGAKVKRFYHRPATPCERLLEHPSVDDQTKGKLRSLRRQLDPVALLHGIREGQAALASSDKPTEGPGRKTLDQFLSLLPKLWRDGEARPTHRAHPVRRRYWRTRKDPFEGVWLDILRWLQRDPDSSAKVMFDRLQREHPGRFPDGQLRTLQRCVKQWRRVMAKKLVYACMDGDGETPEIEVVGDNGALGK